MQYTSVPMTPGRALLHLMIYFTLNDRKFKENEMDVLNSYYTQFNLIDIYKISDEVKLFLDYQLNIGDHYDYLSFLISKIGMKYPATVYSIALDLAVADNDFSEEEKILLEMLADILKLDAVHQDLLQETFVGKRLLKQNIIML